MDMSSKPGLRERKKFAAMRRIQEVAMDLFDEREFADVTIEEIAETADVSPSSVYRYFGTKEQVVLWDDFDVRLLDSFEAEFASHRPVEAMRRSLSGAITELFNRDDDLVKRKTRYALEEPALRPALLEQTDVFTQRVAEAFARASGQAADELEPQVVAATLIAALMAAARHWYSHGYQNPVVDEFEQALAIVERGL
jgi:AcrR family transcriptional regulator